MRRRSSTDPNDALELFLDAISNVFGGVLFVALLVVLMLQMTSKAPAPSEAAEAPDVAEQLRALEAAARDADAAAAAELQALTARQAELQAAIDEALRRTKAAQQRQAELRAALRETAEQMAEARDAARGAEEALHAAKAERDGLVRLPEFHSSPKQEAPWLIAHGRVAPLLQYDAEGNPVGTNTAVIQVHDGGRVSLKPNAGRPLNPDNAQTVARDLTRGLSPGRHFVSLAVWEDSFTEAAALRDALVAAGFEYGLVLLQAGETVPTGAQGGVQ